MYNMTRAPHFYFALILALSVTIVLLASITAADMSTMGSVSKKLNLVFLCSSLQQRCVPPHAGREITDIISSSAAAEQPQRAKTGSATTDASEADIFLVYTDGRSAKAADDFFEKMTRNNNNIIKTNKNKKMKKEKVGNEEGEPSPLIENGRTRRRRITRVPCDISDLGGAPSILSCISDSLMARGLSEDDHILVISGAARTVPDSAVSQLRKALISNQLAAVSAVSITRVENIAPHHETLSSSTSSPPLLVTDSLPTTASASASAKEQQQQQQQQQQLFVVFSAGFSRQPPHRSVLGGIHNVISADGLGIDAHDESIREELKTANVDAIDFTASLVMAHAFVQGALHSPATASLMSMNHPGQTTMTLRTLEWCPSQMEEMMWVTRYLAQVVDISFLSSASSSSSGSSIDDASNNNKKQNEAPRRQQQDDALDAHKRHFYTVLSAKERAEIVRQVKRAIEWLESVDSDVCLARTRPGVRFDALFDVPIAPATQFGGPSGIFVLPGESSPSSSSSTAAAAAAAATFSQSLLMRLSHLFNDAIATSHIVLAMEAVAALGNSIGVLPSLQVDIDTTPSATTISYPSRPPTSLLAVGATAPGGNKLVFGTSPTSTKPASFPLVVIWDVYCCKCCGFSSEIELLIADLKHCTVYLTAHVDCFCSGQREGERMALESKMVTVERLAAHPPTDITVFISHSQPFLFQSFWLEQHACDYRIARTMLEASRIPDDWVAALKGSVNEVWVTSAQQKSMFIGSGVPASKIFVIPEAVDTDRLNPDAVVPFRDIDEAALENGWNIHCTRPRQGTQKRQRRYKSSNNSNNNPNSATTGAGAAADGDDDGQQHYIFFGNFKWEDRKSPDILLSSYFDAFYDEAAQQPREDVSLYILTSAFMDKLNPRNHIPIMKLVEQWATRKYAKLFPAAADEEREQDHRPEGQDDMVDTGLESFVVDGEHDVHSTDVDVDDDDGRSADAVDQKQLDEDDDRAHESEIYSFQQEEEKGEQMQMKKHQHQNSDAGQEESAAARAVKQRRLHRHRAFRHWIKHSPRVCLIVDLLPDDQMDRLYSSGDAFVLATRGEGWGLPVIQSMALSLPVITTGAEMVPFITSPDVAYLIDVDGMEVGMEVELMPGAKWAIPSTDHLTLLLRHVLAHKEEAAAVGARGRQFVLQKYSVRVVSAIIERRLNIVANFVSSLYR